MAKQVFKRDSIGITFLLAVGAAPVQSFKHKQTCRPASPNEATTEIKKGWNRFSYYIKESNMSDLLQRHHEEMDLVDHAEKPVHKIIEEIEQEMLNISQLLSTRVDQKPSDTKLND